MRRRRSSLPFMALAAAFFTLGLTSNPAFFYLGVVFLVIGLAALLRLSR